MAQYQNKNKSENKKNVHKAEPNDIITKLYGNDTDALFRKAGLLTLFNHSYRNKQHWILFPIKYTIPLNNNQNRIIANGNVRILLDLEKKAVKKTDIFLQFPEKSYMFMLQYNRLEFCTIPNLVQKNYQFDIDLIASLTGFDSKNIIYNNELSEAGFFSEKTIVKFINTEA